MSGNVEAAVLSLTMLCNLRWAHVAGFCRCQKCSQQRCWVQVLQLSGIVALFFTGICHAHYSYFSVERDAQITLRRFFQFAAFISETFVFAFLGLQVGSQHVNIE